MQQAGNPFPALRVNSPTCKTLADRDDQRGGKTLNHTQGTQLDPAPTAITRGCARFAQQTCSVSDTQRAPCPCRMAGCWSTQAEPAGSRSNSSAPKEPSSPFANLGVSAPFPARVSALMPCLQTRGAAQRNSAQQNPHRSGESSDRSHDSQRQQHRHSIFVSLEVSLLQAQLIVKGSR